MASRKKIDLDPETLLSAYAQGIFPMADRDGSIRFYTADPRGVIPLDDRFHIPSTLRQLMRKDPPVFEIRIDYDFGSTMRACMEARRDGTWIALARRWSSAFETGPGRWRCLSSYAP